MLIGRAYRYGLAPVGQAGLERAIKILRDDVETTLWLLGFGLPLGAGIEELNTSLLILNVPCEWRKVVDA